MNKLLFLLLFIVAIGLYIFNIDQSVTNKFNFVNDIKKYYSEKLINTEAALNKYFSQVKTIENLSVENEELKKYKTLYIDLKTTIDRINDSKTTIIQNHGELKHVKVLSYVNFDDYTKVWLDVKKSDKKIEALISKNYAAGIVISQTGQALALLNGNEKSNYAVFIGENKAPGIVHGLEKSNLIVAKYVPIWIDIKEGDEVITSGMDDIFFEGLQVGKVISIKKMADMQEATIEPYINAIKESYFYVYSKKEEKEKLEKKEASNKKP